MTVHLPSSLQGWGNCIGTQVLILGDRYAFSFQIVIRDHLSNIDHWLKWILCLQYHWIKLYLQPCYFYILQEGINIWRKLLEARPNTPPPACIYVAVLWTPWLLPLEDTCALKRNVSLFGAWMLARELSQEKWSWTLDRSTRGELRLQEECPENFKLGPSRMSAGSSRCILLTVKQ